MDTFFDIAGRRIGTGQPAFIIAEASTNHNGDLDRAKDMVRVAKDIGVDCIKFQTFTPEECLTPGKVFTYTSQGKEVTESEIEMFERLAFDSGQWEELMAFCRDHGVLFLTTVQDSVDLKMMLGLGLSGIKKGSDDFDHMPGLIEAAQTGLPLILSKGMADLGEVDRVIRTLLNETDKLAVLHCVSLYPTDPSLLNLRQIPTLAGLYPEVVWGFSDHSQGTLASTLAVVLGAKIIEKHFTLDHDLSGPDHWFSMDPSEMRQLVQDIRFAEQTMGSGQVVLAPGELKSKSIMRRRLVAKDDMAAGIRLSEDTVTFKRAAEGSFMENWDIIRGNKLRVSKQKDTGIAMSDVDFSNREL